MRQTKKEGRQTWRCCKGFTLFETLIVLAILKKASSSEIRKIAVKNGMTTMLEDGFQRVEEGVTTLEEVLRVIHE